MKNKIDKQTERLLASLVADIANEDVEITHTNIKRDVDWNERKNEWELHSTEISVTYNEN